MRGGAPMPGRLTRYRWRVHGGCGKAKCRYCGEYNTTRWRKRIEREAWERLVRAGKAEEA